MQISNLPASNSFSSTDVLPIEINGVTYKVTGATLAAALQTLGNYLTTENVANNLTTTAAGSVLDARQGKALNDKINATQSGVAIIVDGDTASMDVSVGGYAYIRGNTRGLAEGLYINTSSGVFPTSGGQADGEVFTHVSGGGLNTIQQSMADLNNKIIRLQDKFDAINVDGTSDGDGDITIDLDNNTYALIGCTPDRTGITSGYTGPFFVLPYGATKSGKYLAKILADDMSILRNQKVLFKVSYIRRAN